MMKHDGYVVDHELKRSDPDRSSSLVLGAPHYPGEHCHIPVVRCRKGPLERGPNQRQTSGMPRDNTASAQRFAILWNGKTMRVPARTAHRWAGIRVERVRQMLRQKPSTSPIICSATPGHHNPVQVCRSHRIENNV